MLKSKYFLWILDKSTQFKSMQGVNITNFKHCLMSEGSLFSSQKFSYILFIIQAKLFLSLKYILPDQYWFEMNEESNQSGTSSPKIKSIQDICGNISHYKKFF